MDTWMVAVAAGAGYIAQHFKKFKQTGEHISSESSSFNSSINGNSNSPKQPPNKKCPFRRSTKRDNSKQDDPQGVSTNVTSTSEFDSEGSNVFSPRSRMLLRNRRPVKPLTSLKSCLMAQLHFDHVEMKEYFGTPFASPSSKTIRPFLVTDGNKVINRSSGGTFIESSETIENNDAMLNVCIGMSFGILYSLISHKHEVERLNRLLKQTESLVQDLEEELELKDSVTMQELTIDYHKSQITDDVSPHNLYQYNNDNNSNKELVIGKGKDESFSEIEAELEAELEMLEMNMTSSSLERRISDLFEVDPDYEPGMAEGDFRAADVAVDEIKQDESETPCANYSVSPRELSLRLHELLQSQLEERIKELEAEIESKKTQNWKDLSISDDEIENPNNRVDDGPVVLNLSGEALDAYNEACNEFANFDDDDDDDDDDEDEDDDGREDEKEFDEDDEMEKMLIKHIVEKARQGSPMVLNAQRALFSESNL